MSDYIPRFLWGRTAAGKTEPEATDAPEQGAASGPAPDETNGDQAAADEANGEQAPGEENGEEAPGEDDDDEDEDEDEDEYEDEEDDEEGDEDDDEEDDEEDDEDEDEDSDEEDSDEEMSTDDSMKLDGDFYDEEDSITDMHQLALEERGWAEAMGAEMKVVENGKEVVVRWNNEEGRDRQKYEKKLIMMRKMRPLERLEKMFEEQNVQGAFKEYDLDEAIEAPTVTESEECDGEVLSEEDEDEDYGEMDEEMFEELLRDGRYVEEYLDEYLSDEGVESDNYFMMDKAYTDSQSEIFADEVHPALQQLQGYEEAAAKFAPEELDPWTDSTTATAWDDGEQMLSTVSWTLDAMSDSYTEVSMPEDSESYDDVEADMSEGSREDLEDELTAEEDEEEVDSSESDSNSDEEVEPEGEAEDEEEEEDDDEEVEVEDESEALTLTFDEKKKMFPGCDSYDIPTVDHNPESIEWRDTQILGMPCRQNYDVYDYGEIQLFKKEDLFTSKGQMGAAEELIQKIKAMEDPEKFTIFAKAEFLDNLYLRQSRENVDKYYHIEWPEEIYEPGVEDDPEVVMKPYEMLKMSDKRKRTPGRFINFKKWPTMNDELPGETLKEFTPRKEIMMKRYKTMEDRQEEEEAAEEERAQEKEKEKKNEEKRRETMEKKLREEEGKVAPMRKKQLRDQRLQREMDDRKKQGMPSDKEDILKMSLSEKNGSEVGGGSKMGSKSKRESQRGTTQKEETGKEGE